MEKNDCLGKSHSCLRWFLALCLLLPASMLAGRVEAYSLLQDEEDDGQEVTWSTIGEASNYNSNIWLTSLNINGVEVYTNDVADLAQNIIDAVSQVDLFPGGTYTVSWTGNEYLKWARLSAYFDFDGDGRFVEATATDPGDCLGVMGATTPSGGNLMLENGSFSFTIPEDARSGISCLRLRFDDAWQVLDGVAGSAPVLGGTGKTKPILSTSSTSRSVYDVHLTVGPLWRQSTIAIGGLLFSGELRTAGSYKARLGEFISCPNGAVVLTHSATSDGNTYTVDDLSPVFDALKNISTETSVTIPDDISDLGESYPAYVPARRDGYPQSVKDGSYDGKKYIWDLNPVLDGDCWNLNVKVKFGDKPFNGYGICSLATGSEPIPDGSATFDGGFQFYQNRKDNGDKGLTLKGNNIKTEELKSADDSKVYLTNCTATFELKYRTDSEGNHTLRVMLYTDNGISVDASYSCTMLPVQVLSGMFGSDIANPDNDTQILGLTYNFIDEEAEAEAEHVATSWLHNPHISLTATPSDYTGRYCVDASGALWGSGMMQQLMRVPSQSQLTAAGNRFDVPGSMLALSPDAFVNNPAAKVKMDLQRYLMVDDLLKPANVSLQLSRNSHGEEQLIDQIASGARFAEVFIDRSIAAGAKAIVTLPFSLTASEAGALFGDIAQLRSVTVDGGVATVGFEKLTTVTRACMPYLVTGTEATASGITLTGKQLLSGLLKPKAENGNITASLVGTFDRTTASGPYLLQADGSFSHAESADVQGFDGYLSLQMEGGTLPSTLNTQLADKFLYNNIKVEERYADGSHSLGSITIVRNDHGSLPEAEDGVYTLDAVSASLTLTATANGENVKCLGWWMERTLDNDETLTTKISSHATVTVIPPAGDITYFTAFASQLMYSPQGKDWSIDAVVNNDLANGRSVTLIGGNTVTDDILAIPSTFDYAGEQYTVTQLDNEFLANNTKVKTLRIPSTVENLGCHLQYALPLTDGVQAKSEWALGDKQSPVLTGDDWIMNFKYGSVAEGDRLLSSGVDGDDNPLFKVYVDEGRIKLGLRGATEPVAYAMPDIDGLAALEWLRGELHHTGGRLYLTVITSEGHVYDLENGEGVQTGWVADYVIRNLRAGGDNLQSLGYNFITTPNNCTYTKSYNGRGKDYGHLFDEKKQNGATGRPADWLKEVLPKNDNEQYIERIDLIGNTETEPIDNNTDFSIHAVIEYGPGAFNPFGSALICTGKNPAADDYTGGFQVYVTSHGHAADAHHVMVKTSKKDGAVSDKALEVGRDIVFDVRHKAGGKTTYTIKQGERSIYSVESDAELNTIRWFCTSIVEGTNIRELTLRSSRADDTQLIFDSPVLEKIEVDGANPLFSSSAEGLLYDKHKLLLLRVPNAATGVHKAPDDLMEVSSRAFDNNTGGALLGTTLSKFYMSSNLQAQHTCIYLSQKHKGDRNIMEKINSEFKGAIFPQVRFENDDRRLSVDKWNTFVLPFDLSATQRGDICTRVRQLHSIAADEEGNTVLYFDVVDKDEGLKGGVPYLLEGVEGAEMKFNSKSFVPQLQDVTTGECDVNGTIYTARMTGTYDWIKITDPNDYYIKNNMFYYVNKSANVQGYRAYVHLDAVDTDGQAAPVRMMSIGMFGEMGGDGDNGVATGMENVRISSHDVVDVYDLRGQKLRSNASAINPLQGLGKGVYIVGGRKLIVK